MPWTCPRCKLNNTAFNKTCAWDKCKTPRPTIYDDDETSRIIEGNKVGNERLELHAKFYNAEGLVVTALSDAELIDHIAELEIIIVEAKARYSRASEERRQRKAKLDSESKAWQTSSDYDPSVSDALSAVKRRKDRMSKADKLREQMEFLGVENVEELVRNVEKKATDKQMNGITFNKPKVKADSPSDNQPSEPIDFDSLKFD